MKYHCFFEQSGTFKNEFIKLGIEAIDYDIKNDFGQTDKVIDLFNEIDKAYLSETSVFDDFESDDRIIAFFPCIYFETQNSLLFQGLAPQFKNYSIEQKCEYAMQRHGQLHKFYCWLNKLVIVCERRKIPLIIENPLSPPHYLTQWWCCKPAIIDKNRRLSGDYYKKPTQYWFFNLEPNQNMFLEPIEETEFCTIHHAKSKCGRSIQVMRSMIHPQYARNFIKKYLL